MRLLKLDAKFIQYRKTKVDPTIFVDGILHPDGWAISLPHVDSLEEAHGIVFKCPKCFHADGHRVICWFVGKVPDEAQPGPGRWIPAGIGIDDLTFIPGNPPRAISVQLLGGCGWHGFVKAGDAT